MTAGLFAFYARRPADYSFAADRGVDGRVSAPAALREDRLIDKFISMAGVSRCRGDPAFGGIAAFWVEAKQKTVLLSWGFGVF